MDWVGPTIAGAFDLIGGGLNALYSAEAADTAYERQVDLLRMQQAWAEYMASTAHQREVKDLRAAGLNPILSATGGNGASSPVVSAPGVAQASGNPLSFNNLAKTLVNSAEVKQADAAEMNAKTQKKSADAKIENDNRLTDAQIEQSKAQTELYKAQTSDIKSGHSVNRYPTAAFQPLVDAIAKGFDNARHNSASAVSRGEREVQHGWRVDPSDFDIVNPKDISRGKYRDPDDGLVKNGVYYPAKYFDRYVYTIDGNKHFYYLRKKGK